MATLTKFNAGIYDVGDGEGFNFKDDDDGDQPAGLTCTGASLAVINNMDGHTKVLKNRLATNSAYRTLTDQAMDNGIVEIWFMASGLCNTAMGFRNTSGTVEVAFLSFKNTGDVYYENSGADQDTGFNWTANTWHHVSLEWNNSGGNIDFRGDGNLANDKMRLYFDGVQAGADFDIDDAEDPDLFYLIGGGSGKNIYYDAMVISYDGDADYTIGDNLSIIADTTITASLIASMYVDHPTSLIPTSVKFGNDRYEKYFPICVAEIASSENIDLGTILTITDNHTSAAASASETIFKGMVMRKLVLRGREAYPKYLIFSNSREKDDIYPEGSYTVDTDGYIADIITNDCDLITNGGLTDGADLGTFTAGGEKNFTRIIQTCCRLDGYIAYDDPASGADNADLVYDDGSVDTGVDIDESTADMGFIGIENIDEHINYVMVRGGVQSDGTRAESTPAEDSTSQGLYGVRKYYDADSNLITDAACTAKAAVLLAANQYGRLKIKLYYYHSTQGMLQPGENVTFEWDSSTKNIGFDIESQQCIIARNVYDVKNGRNKLLLMTGIYYPPLTTDDIVAEQGQLIEQNRTNILEGNYIQWITDDAAADYIDEGDTTEDGTWYELDMDTYATVPDGTIGFFANVVLKSATATHEMAFRDTSQANAINITSIIATVANMWMRQMLFIPLDSDHKFDYKISAGISNHRINPVAWVIGF